MATNWTGVVQLENMWKELLKGLINPDSVYSAADASRFPSTVVKELDQFTKKLGEAVGTVPQVTENTVKHPGDPRITFGYSDGSSQETVRSYVIPVSEQKGKVMESVFGEREVVGGYDGVPRHWERGILGERPSHEQVLKDRVEINLRQRAGNSDQATVEVIAQKFIPSSIGRGVFDAIRKSAQTNVSLGGSVQKELLKKVASLIDDVTK